MPIPIADRGYPHPELLAESDWLEARLTEPTLRIVDARADEDYANGHISGAVHLNGFSLGGLRAGPEMPDPRAFAELVGSLGIDGSTPVVVYGASDLLAQMAGVVAWAFLYYGHPDVRLLDGGITTWAAEGRALSTELHAHEPRTYSAQPVDGLLCSLDQAKAAVDAPGAVFWDTRTLGEFDGSEAGWNPPPRLGHLPGAVRLDYAELFDPAEGTLRPAGELKTLLGEHGITPESAIHTY